MRLHLWLIGLFLVFLCGNVGAEPVDRVEALRRAVVSRDVHPWAIEPLSDPISYSIVEDEGAVWGLTVRSVHGLRRYTVWRWESNGWTELFDYEAGAEQLEGVDLVWQERVDLVYKLHEIEASLRDRLESPSARRIFSASDG